MTQCYTSELANNTCLNLLNLLYNGLTRAYLVSPLVLSITCGRDHLYNNMFAQLFNQSDWSRNYQKHDIIYYTTHYVQV